MVSILLLGVASTAFGQPRVISIVSSRNSAAVQPPSRDFYFCIPANIPGNGKYIALSITPSANAEIDVQCGNNQIVKLAGKAGVVTVYNVPMSMEITSSGLREDKAIHVWSLAADLSVYWMSHAFLSSDGSSVMPTSGWGTDYVVAAYGARYDSVDLPSEFTIVANQDNTNVTITPSQDIRITGQPTKVLHPGHVAFTETLSKGQTIQYQLVLAQNTDDYDATSTIIHSDRPVGVTGASMSPNIPADFPYSNFVADIMPPVSHWGKTYFSAPFITRKGGDTFLVVSSSDNQKIWTTDQVTGKRIYALLNKHDAYFRPDIEQPTKWESDSVFMLVQYCNSATWPDGQNGSGDPCEVVLNGVELYTKQVVIDVPSTSTQDSEHAYTNYVNVICKKSAESITTFDGGTLTAAKAHRLISPDPNYSMFVLGPVAEGAHTVASDSGVGCYLYGYGFDESYAWGSAMSIFPQSTGDTSAPLMTAGLGECSSITLVARDSGIGASGVIYLLGDSATNMEIVPASDYLAGQSAPSRTFSVRAIDSSKSGSIIVSAYDKAGNTVAAALTFQPRLLSLDRQSIVFVGTSQDTTIDVAVTMTNPGIASFPFTQASLTSALHGGTSRGISILSMDTSALAPGVSHYVTLRFKGDATKFVTDTLVIGSDCILYHLPLRTNYIATFFATDVQFNITREQDTDKQLSTLTNTGTADVTIDSVWTGTDFYVDPLYSPNKLPITLKPTNSTTMRFLYVPSTTGLENALAYFRSPEAGVKTCRLTGTGTLAAVGGDHPSLSAFDVTAYPNPLSLSQTHRLTFNIGSANGGTSTITVSNALGTTVASSKQELSGDMISLDLPSIVPGVYYYRIEKGTSAQAGRIVVMP